MYIFLLSRFCQNPISSVAYLHNTKNTFTSSTAVLVMLSFSRLFVSISSPLFISHQIYKTEWQGSECFPALGELLLLRTLAKSQQATASFYKEALTCTHRQAHTERFMCTIIQILPVFPRTLTSWVFFFTTSTTLSGFA